MKLIVADKWAQYYSEERNRTPVANDYEAGQNDALDRVDTWMEEQPTIEAAPVVHGRWDKCWQEKSKHYFQCSNCQTAYMDGVSGAIAPEYGSRAWRYCPNCGAKMDGGVSDG